MAQSPPDLRSLREPQKTFEELEIDAMRAQLRVVSEELDVVRISLHRLIVVVYFMLCAGVLALLVALGDT